MNIQPYVTNNTTNPKTHFVYLCICKFEEGKRRQNIRLENIDREILWNALLREKPSIWSHNGIKYNT